MTHARDTRHDAVWDAAVLAARLVLLAALARNVREAHVPVSHRRDG